MQKEFPKGLSNGILDLCLLWKYKSDHLLEAIFLGAFDPYLVEQSKEIYSLNDIMLSLTR